MKRITACFFMSFISMAAFTQIKTCDCFVAVDSSYQIVPMVLGFDTGGPPDYRCNECSSQAIRLPFSFCFYGKLYDTVYINNKGSISFNHPFYSFKKTGILTPDTMLIAPFYADINERADNLSYVYYKVTPTHLIVQWNSVGYLTLDDDLYDNFQVIITNGSTHILQGRNNVEFCYGVNQWACADTAITWGGFNGVPAVEGINKGDGVHYAQMAAFTQQGYNYTGPYDTNSGLYWADSKSFEFNTCVYNDTIPPVIVNPDLCDTVTMCAGDTLLFPASFICPQKGQKATLSLISTGFYGALNLVDTSSTTGILTCNVEVAPVMLDTGIHTVSIIATDNSTPPLADTISYKILVQACNNSGINTITSNYKVNLYPNPSSGIFHLQWSVVSGQWSVEVYNVLGEKVFSKNYQSMANGYQLDLRSKCSGVYFYRLISSEGVETGRGKLILDK